MSGWWGWGAKAAAWPHRLEQIEKKLSGLVEAQTKTNAEFIQIIHELRLDLTRLEGTIREVVTEAKNSAAGQTAQMTHQIHSDVSAIRERLARVETKLELGLEQRPAPDPPPRPKPHRLP